MTSNEKHTHKLHADQISNADIDTKTGAITFTFASKDSETKLTITAEAAESFTQTLLPLAETAINIHRKSKQTGSTKQFFQQVTGFRLQVPKRPPFEPILEIESGSDLWSRYQFPMDHLSKLAELLNKRAEEAKQHLHLWKQENKSHH